MIPMIAIELVTRFLPGIVGMLKGPKAEEAAQQVIDVARKVTGKDKPEDALDALKQDPALAHAYAMRLLDLEQFRDQLAADERKDERRTDVENLSGARVRDIDLRKLTGGKNERADWMVLMAAVGLIGSLGGMVWLAHIKATHPEAITEGVFAALLTQLANIGAFFGLSLRDAFTFEFGSSRGSRVKDEAAAIQTAVASRRD